MNQNALSCVECGTSLVVDGTNISVCHQCQTTNYLEVSRKPFPVFPVNVGGPYVPLKHWIHDYKAKTLKFIIADLLRANKFVVNDRHYQDKNEWLVISADGVVRETKTLNDRLDGQLFFGIAKSLNKYDGCTTKFIEPPWIHYYDVGTIVLVPVEEEAEDDDGNLVLIGHRVKFIVTNTGCEGIASVAFENIQRVLGLPLELRFEVSGSLHEHIESLRVTN